MAKIKYAEQLNFHTHRLNKFTKASKEQKEFSGGYVQFHALLNMDEYSTKQKNDFMSKQMNIAKDPKNPNHDRAKGFIASMFDFKKHIPPNMTVWGNTKTKK